MTADAIRQMTYRPVRPAGGRTAAVETMTFRRLRELNDGGTQRADFHVLGIVDAGRGTITVDFQRHPFDRRTAVWVRPGAVHRWEDIDRVQGHLVLFVPTAPVTDATRELAASPDLAPAWRVPDTDRPLVDAARDHLLLETPSGDARAGWSPVPELPEILLSALVARLGPPHPRDLPANPVFRLFRSLVETHYREHHDAAYYAQELGYAPRTLSRAVQEATGRTAKAYIVERITLEAKRLLAHDGLTAAGCARALGFPDASNFSVFFRGSAGMRPGAWQTAEAARHSSAAAGRSR